MQSPFNISNGSIHLQNGIIITRNPSLEQLKGLGLEFVRQLALNAGWVLYSTTDLPLADKSAYFSFRVKESIANGVSFGFAGERGRDPLDQQEAYRAFLERWLGQPTSTDFDGKIITFEFPWGVITSAYDPRNGTTSMDIAWK